VATLRVRVVSPATVVYEGEASSLVAPAWDGMVGILPGHAPMIVLLGAGPLDIDVPGGGSTRFQIAGGVLKVVEDQVTILTDYAGDTPPEVLPESARFHPEDIIEDSALAGNPLV
jgi:F-type H+-transporting ATPase subunit epsilon